MNFDKIKYVKITSNLPKRENTNLQSFKNEIKSKTYFSGKKLSLFFWNGF